LVQGRNDRRNATFVIARSPDFIGTTKQSKICLQWFAMKNYWVYMMTNKSKTVIYTGVTNDLNRRVWEHKNKKGSSFTKKYSITKLVYCENFDQIYDAIAAEKRIKAGSRAKKIQLIESRNSEWQDLYEIAGV